LGFGSQRGGGSWVLDLGEVVGLGFAVGLGFLLLYSDSHGKKIMGREKTTKAWLLGFGRWSGSPEWRTKKKREMRREKKKLK
jgi:hypothetical protein